jgi:hypothetical protein
VSIGVPKYCSNDIPVIINGNDNLAINSVETVNNHNVLCILKETFPARAGIVTDIIETDKVYVITSGMVTNTYTDLIINHTYIIDKNGNLTGKYHDIGNNRPFMVTGNLSDKATIIYNII